jgi:hypothetical protein
VDGLLNERLPDRMSKHGVYNQYGAAMRQRLIVLLVTLGLAAACVLWLIAPSPLPLMQPDFTLPGPPPPPPPPPPSR